MKQEKDIWTYRVHSRRLTICYTPESIRHPAKMHLGMCRQIIRLYSKKGDIILDPMAGIGTTIIEGMLLGRNVIGIEYEKKFVDLAAANIKKTNEKCAFIKSLGKGICIKGDSRELFKILKENIDSIIFSPSYAHESVTTQGDIKRTDKWAKLHPKLVGKDAVNYSDDSNNIGNLTYKPDVIISSPPYSEALQRGGGISKEGHTNDPKLKDRCYHKDTTNPDMIKKVKEEADKFAKKYPNKRNVLMESYLAMTGDPRYKNQRRDWMLGPEYSKDSGNIGNLSHGDIDVIMTSPPYEGREASMHKSKFKNPEEFARISEQRYKNGEKKGHPATKEAILKSMNTLDKEYSSDKNNIGNKTSKNYLTEMMKIYQQCFLILKNKGYMILVTKNFVRNGKQIRLDLDTIKLVEKAGFKLIKRHYRTITNPSFWITNAIQKYEKKYPGKQHPYPLEEDILVFQK